MSQDQSLTTTEGSDMEVIPAPTPLVFTKQQMEVLGECEHHLRSLQRPIAVQQEELAYLWLEAGLYLLKARAVHPSVSRETDGKTGRYVARQTEEPRGFNAWFSRPEIGYSRATAYRYMQGALNHGLTEESTLDDIAAIKRANRLADTDPEKFSKRPKRHEPAVEIVTPAPSEDDAFVRLELDWMEHEQGLKRFYAGWATATRVHFLEEDSWKELSHAERREIHGLLYDSYRKFTDFLKEEDADRKNSLTRKSPESNPKKDKTKQPPKLPMYHFNFEKARGSRKLKGGRFWYGYRASEGKIKLHPFRGKQSEIEEIKKTLPADVQVVGPFYTKSLRYAQDKVKAALSGEQAESPLSDGIEAGVIEVPKP